MTQQNELQKTLGSMILSASGWRGVFAIDGNEESPVTEISPSHRLIAAGAACVFAGFLYESTEQKSVKPLVLVGSDTRPTGRAIAQAVIHTLVSCGCSVKWSGFTAAPEIMAWAHSMDTAARNENPIGFIYISASHNPIGHNGLKFGLTDGGVLQPDTVAALIAAFNSLMAEPDIPARLIRLLDTADSDQVNEIYTHESAAKQEALNAYFNFSNVVAWNQNSAESTPLHSPLTVIKISLAKKPVGIVCDFNGSSRSVSIDRKIFTSLGCGFAAINEKAGAIAHRIVPEGVSLEPCMRFLEEKHRADSSYIMGYTPDCDGDRGNLVIWDQARHCARTLEAQEVFALACVAELSQMVWTGDLTYDSNGTALTKAAVVVNDATSLRIDRIAAAFGVSIFRAETGEANVVGLARKIRGAGYLVRILGEGSAGGNITHPQAVRDPLNTVLALTKLLTIRSRDAKPGLFELWCAFSNQRALYHDHYDLADIIASLPPFITTAAYEKAALLKVKTPDHSVLKNRYQQIFLREWDKRKEEMASRYGIYTWEAVAYNGTEERRGIGRFGDAGKGGLKIYFSGRDGRRMASVWMRGSATEPVFRIMADIEGRDKQAEQNLIEWQRRMVTEADAG